MNEPTPEQLEQTRDLINEFIARINTGEVSLEVAGDVGLNLYAQMTLEMGVTCNDAMHAVNLARGHILHQAAMRGETFPSTATTH